jgi:Zn-dependent protease with chaperone function
VSRFDPGLPDDSVNVSGTNPIVEAGVLVGGLLAIVVALAVVSSVTMEWIVPRLPIGLEVRLFGGGWLPDAASADADDDAPDPREAALQALVERVARHWPESPYTFQAQVWPEQTPNAFALPGGWIGVTTGLLGEVGSENELVFVLGHEIGHFRHRDHLKGLGRGLALGVVLSAVGLSGVGAAGDLAGLAGGLAQRSFDRAQESRADAFGLEVLAAEYGHVAGAVAFFRHTPDAGGLMGTQLEGYLSSHPVSAERIAALEELADARGLAREGDLVPLPEALRAAPGGEGDEATAGR